MTIDDKVTGKDSQVAGPTRASSPTPYHPHSRRYSFLRTPLRDTLAQSGLITAISDLRGLYSWPEVIATVGDTLWRRALSKVGLAASAAFGFYFLGQKMGNPLLTMRQAWGLTGLVAGSTIIGGIITKWGPQVAERRAIRTTEANDFHLLGQKKQQHFISHVNALWERVYSLESLVKWTPEQIKAEEDGLESHRESLIVEASCLTRGMNWGPSNPAMRRMICEAGKSYNGFLLSALVGIQHPAPPLEVKEVTGFGLGKLKDWYQTGIFSQDLKVANHYWASATILKIKQELGWYLTKDELVRGWTQAWWRTRIAKTLSQRVGKGIRELNKKYDTSYFSAQHFLWPTERLDTLLSKKFGIDAVKTLDHYRRSIFTSMFGDPATADRIIRRAFAPTVEFSTWLRLHYDPDYALGYLPQTAQSDYASVGLTVPGTFAKLQEQAHADMDRFLAYASRMMGNGNSDPESRRAAMIAYHTNNRGVKTMLTNGKTPDREYVRRVIAIAAARKEEHSIMLTKIRKHQTLALLELQEALNEVHELMEYSSPLLRSSAEHADLPAGASTPFNVATPLRPDKSDHSLIDLYPPHGDDRP